jgi:uncharacterized protein
MIRFTTALIVLAATALQAQETKPLKVLLVTGGCCHDYENQKRILADGLSQRANLEFTIVHEEAPGGKNERTHQISLYKDPNWAQGYDVVVHNECFGAVTDNAFIERISKPHHDGVPAVMLHCSAHSYRAASSNEWRKTLGQKSMSHEKNRDLLVKNVAPEHPVMRGFPMEWLDKKDELYKNEELYPNFVPLAKAYGEDTKKDHVLVWLNTAEKGRTFGTTMGHNNSTMEDPVFLDLVARGLLWACGKLGDDGKPVSGYEGKQK